MVYAPLRQSIESADGERRVEGDEERDVAAVGDELQDFSWASKPAPFESRSSPDGRRSACSLAGFLVLSAITVLGLAGLSLSVWSGFSKSDLDQAGAGESQHYQHQDAAPEVPGWRDANQYILPTDWDFEATSAIREYNWTITDAVFNPDGIYRPMVLINNQFPGPLVEANDGDTIVVHIANRGVNATAIHFHGMYQNGTNAMDGAVGVTQCPIAPGADYTYRFKVKGQSGTYWYHAHSSAQASDGLVGPFVVHAPNERTELQRLRYASDRVVLVQDHYHNTTAELLMDYLAPGKENAEPIPPNGLINGRGVRNCTDFRGWNCDAYLAHFPELHLEKNQRHRLRIINVGAFAEFQVQVDQHPFYVTEVDGTDVEPEPFHRLQISPAQRYSIIIETNVTSSGPRHGGNHPDGASFWLRARMTTHCFTDAAADPYLEAETKAIIRYVDSDDAGGDRLASLDQRLPTSANWDETIDVLCKDMNTSLLHPTVMLDPPQADDYILLRASFRATVWSMTRGFFNTSTWRANTTSPALHRFLDAPSNLTTLAPSAGVLAQASPDLFNADREFVVQTEGIKTIDIAINNFDDGAHPFHLHGTKFFVLVPSLKGGPPANASELSALLSKTGALEHPVRRDTVVVGSYEWAIIRVVLDNPGMWAFHCHNTWHSESGMAMQFLVRADEMRRQQGLGLSGVGDEERELCKRPGVERGVRPDDSIWFGHFD